MAEGKKKRKPRKIITTRHDDNTFSHEHQHDDGKHSMFAGTSADVADVQQHMADHLGGGLLERIEIRAIGKQPDGHPLGWGVHCRGF